MSKCDVGSSISKNVSFCAKIPRAAPFVAGRGSGDRVCSFGTRRLFPRRACTTPEASLVFRRQSRRPGRRAALRRWSCRRHCLRSDRCAGFRRLSNGRFVGWFVCLWFSQDDRFVSYILHSARGLRLFMRLSVLDLESFHTSFFLSTTRKKRN